LASGKGEERPDNKKAHQSSSAGAKAKKDKLFFGNKAS